MLHARGQNEVGHPTPSILALSRQGMPNLKGTSIEGVSKGGYVVHGGEGKPDVILMSSGGAGLWAAHSCLLVLCSYVQVLVHRRTCCGNAQAGPRWQPCCTRGALTTIERHLHPLTLTEPLPLMHCCSAHMLQVI